MRFPEWVSTVFYPPAETRLTLCIAINLCETRSSFFSKNGVTHWKTTKIENYCNATILEVITLWVERVCSVTIFFRSFLSVFGAIQFIPPICPILVLGPPQNASPRKNTRNPHTPIDLTPCHLECYRVPGCSRIFLPGSGEFRLFCYILILISPLPSLTLFLLSIPIGPLRIKLSEFSPTHFNGKRIGKRLRPPRGGLTWIIGGGLTSNI